MGYLLIVLGSVGSGISGFAATITLFGACGIWLSTHLSQPLFQNADVLLAEVWTMFGWSALAWAISVVIFLIGTGLKASDFSSSR